MRGRVRLTGLLIRLHDAKEKSRSLITYRILETSEVGRLAPILQSLGWNLPYPQTTTVLAAEDKGKIVGFVCQTLLPHLEPEWVAPEYRGTGMADELALRGAEVFRTADVKNFLSVAGNPHAERICRDVLGMKKVEGAVYRSS